MALVTALALLLPGCDSKNDLSGSNNEVKPLSIGVAFETLQTEFWVAAIEAIRTELTDRNMVMIEAIANGDSNKQFEQIRNFIARKVDGIIIAPKDKHTVIPMIKAANRANIPIIVFNRPPAESNAKSVAVVADNYSLSKSTVEYMIQRARDLKIQCKAMILIGDLSDINSIGRRDGFDDAVKANSDIVEVVSRVPTEWNAEKARAGVTNALQAHPDINFIFTSSDFLLPAISAALKEAGKYKKLNEKGHVLLAGFDGDATAYQMLVD
ncbi:MAG: sugar ABC transporter substrate-binding protein, partial [Planctomycetota bacterium]